MPAIIRASPRLENPSPALNVVCPQSVNENINARTSRVIMKSRSSGPVNQKYLFIWSIQLMGDITVLNVLLVYILF